MTLKPGYLVGLAVAAQEILLDMEDSEDSYQVRSTSVEIDSTQYDLSVPEHLKKRFKTSS